jgi:hypothetical protein
MKWITRERPKIDRIACPWLIKKFVDPKAQYTHQGDQCTFDYIIKKHGLTDPALLQLAAIVRGADTARFDLAQQAAGLWAISAGLSYNFKDDHEQLAFGLILYDALYSWAKYVQTETHTWTNN